MRDKLLAVCDRDERYLQGMQEYFLRKGIADFEIVVFSNPGQALAYSMDKQFEILLVGQTAYEDCVENIKTKKVYLLWEKGQSTVTGYPVIAKFQSMEQILAQVMSDYVSDKACTGSLCHTRAKTRIISFYSPDRADAQTVAALAAGEALAASGSKVLYLNLRAFAGFEELLHTTYEADVTDYFYFVLQYADKALYKLESMRKSIGGLHYLPPALDYADLLQITGEQWEEAVTILADSGAYEVLVIDLSEACQGFYSLLARSDRIIFVQGSSCQAQAMEAQYRRLLSTRGVQSIMDKTRSFRLNEGWEQEYSSYEQLGSSRLGEQMKRILGDMRDEGIGYGKI